MDLAERIERRLNHRFEDRLVVDWDPLSPAVHLPEPVGREFVFEALLDAIDPVFDGDVPPDVYVHGPSGSGKSAIVTALVSVLQEQLSSSRNAIHTATRADNLAPDFGVSYVDARRTSSEFQLYHSLLDALVTDRIPDRGIGTAELERRLREQLGYVDGVVVVVDHLDEPGTLSPTAVANFFASFETVSWLGVSRTPPGETAAAPVQTVEVPSYNYEIIDILTTRGAAGLSKGLDHSKAKDLAEWADGNAHDALAALFGAVAVADDAGRTDLDQAAIERGKESVPDDTIHIGRVLALPENKQEVLYALLQIDTDEDHSIEEVSELLAERTDLSQGTIRRYIYELAKIGVLERQEVAVGLGSAGRRPSAVSPKFPTLVYERLHGDTEE
ncbi:MAG: Cdc6/Cdc18 family protein [Haloarculaceae archaeon]